MCNFLSVASRVAIFINDGITYLEKVNPLTVETFKVVTPNFIGFSLAIEHLDEE